MIARPTGRGRGKTAVGGKVTARGATQTTTPFYIVATSTPSIFAWFTRIAPNPLQDLLYRRIIAFIQGVKVKLWCIMYILYMVMISGRWDNSREWSPNKPGRDSNSVDCARRPGFYASYFVGDAGTKDRLY